jgi:adenine deaminase
MFHVEQKNKIVISKIFGNIVDVFKKDIYPGEIQVENTKIIKIKKISAKIDGYILPGLVDSHIHIESSMLTPQHFSRIAVSHGTVSTVSDPHEIANVLGIDGVKFMIRNAKLAKIKFYFGVPSCVPPTSFESSGAYINTDDIEKLFIDEKLKFLSEMMNFPGVINKNKDVLDKLVIAKKYNKRIDGHSPGLKGEELDRYLEEGIETDHECLSYEEAIEKIQKGMKIQIRQGSAAKNFIALEKLIDQFPDKILLCSDDLHPDDLVDGHINKLIKFGLQRKLNLFNLLRAATINPVQHYNLDVGLLKESDPADFIIVDDLDNFMVNETYINGELVFEKGRNLIRVYKQQKPNKFNIEKIVPDDLFVPDLGKKVKVINAFDGELITSCSEEMLKVKNGFLTCDIKMDILKIVVLNRYEKEAPAVAFIRNFGLKTGAMGSSIAHDCHNIIAVGVNDDDLCNCINWIIKQKGGIAIFDGKSTFGIPLPVAGIMSDKPAEWVAEKYKEISLITQDLGCKLKSSFMTLSFMGLLVIPDLKISNKGLFDGKKFELTSLYT